VTVAGHPARSGAPRSSFWTVTLADGRVLPEKGMKGNGVKLTDEPSSEFQAFVTLRRFLPSPNRRRNTGELRKELQMRKRLAFCWCW